MKIKILLLTVFVTIGNLFAQTDSLTNQSINVLNNRITILENNADSLVLKKDLENIKTKIIGLANNYKTIEENNKKYLDENAALKKSLIELNKKIKKVESAFTIEKKNRAHK